MRRSAKNVLVDFLPVFWDNIKRNYSGQHQTRAKDLPIGFNIGRLRVIQRAGTSAGKKSAMWLCECLCGKQVTLSYSRLHLKQVKSCGCLQRDVARARGLANATHGASHHNRKNTEYRIWEGMKRRCLSPKHNGFRYYGGRGITVCDRWLHSFENFLADMGPRPRGKTLDRYPNNDGNYEPNNCRWATPHEQNMNRRKTKAIESFSTEELQAELQRRTVRP
jgi:hypothetical protein